MARIRTPARAPGESPRLVVSLLILLMLAPSVVPSASAYHRDEPIEYPVIEVPPAARPRSDPETIPTVDELRGEINARQDATIDDLNTLLLRSNLSLERYLPAVPANVLSDDVDGGRIGGLGNWTWNGPWRAAQGAGINGTGAWTITNASGRYPTMDAELISPALDLSAYILGQFVLVTGTPGAISPSELVRTTCIAANGPTSGQINPATCGFVAEPIPQGRQLVEDQITLVLTQRYHFPAGLDGGQVRLYTTDPSDPDSVPILLEPQPGFGNYSPDGVVSLRMERGFTGERDWETVAFDLTPWAHKQVWIGLRAATSIGADRDPNYWGNRFRGTSLPGWAIDDIQLRAPAYANNLKVYPLEGPGRRLSAGDPHLRIQESAEMELYTHVLNAGGATRETALLWRLEGTANGTYDVIEKRVLKPGEVWRAFQRMTAPDLEGSLMRVTVTAYHPTPTGGQAIPDPTPDNDRTESWIVSTVRQATIKLATDAILVDDNAPVLATANITNLGNVPIEVEVELAEMHELAGIAHGKKNIAIAPGETAKLSWTVTSAIRGGHKLVANLTGALLPAVNASMTYYVHASPPDILFTGPRNFTGWDALLATAVSPEDDGMWVARTSGTANTEPVLRATPIPGALIPLTNVEDIRVSLRYAALRNAQPARLVLGYPNAFAADIPTAGAFTEQWSATLQMPDRNGPQKAQDQGVTWTRATFNVTPDPARGYLDIWSVQGLEARITPKLTAGANSSGFFLDDLRVSAIPVGGTEGDRTTLIHLTGLPGDGGLPAEPSNCNWEVEGTAFGLPGAERSIRNCWRTMDAAEAHRIVNASRWSTEVNGRAPLLGDEAALWTYRATAALDPKSDRLTTPVMRFPEVTDPVLTFDHEYAFPGGPADDANGNRYEMFQIGYVEIQWRTDSGEWSPFVPIEPVDGYAHVLSHNAAGDVRNPQLGYVGGAGYFYPSPCVLTTPACAGPGDGQIRNKTADGKFLITHYPALGPQRAEFQLATQDALAGVDLSNREVRLGFHASYNANVALSSGTPGSFWTISNVRVTPVSVFAIDGAVRSVALDLPYDHETIGIGPGTMVPINVTVANVGRYAEAFSLTINVSRLGGDSISNETRVIGLLAAGEVRSVRFDWDVPQDEDIGYVIKAQVVPTRPDTHDENPYNDARKLGLDGSVYAITVIDLAVAAAASPSLGRETLARYLPIIVYNRGNVPLQELTISRAVERLTAGERTKVHTQTFRIDGPIAPDPAGIRLERLSAKIDGRDARVDDGFFTPNTQGRYIQTVVAAPPLGESDITDNVHRSEFFAERALAFADFEGEIGWHTNAPDVWGPGDGFRSAGALMAANRTSGAIAPNTDAWVETPSIPLSRAQTAVVNLFQRYDLEKGYDAALVEVSLDGETWWPVPLARNDGSTGYPVPIVNSNPLAAGQRADQVTWAISGNSREEPVQLDGWAPATFDLSSVPQLSETVPFEDLFAPKPREGVARQESSGAYVADWMQITPNDPTDRWEILNVSEERRAQAGSMWWSGFASTSGLNTSRMGRLFNVNGIDPNATFFLTWRDERPGSVTGDWKGTGGGFGLTVSQLDDNGTRVLLADGADATPLAREGGWTTLALPIHGVNPSRLLNVTFIFTSQQVHIATSGWTVENIDLRAIGFVNGTVTTLGVFTSDDETDATKWGPDWIRVPSIPSFAAPWTVVNAVDSRGLERPMWKLDLNANRTNVDTRLVTPAVDLSDLAGSIASMRLTHSYDLLWEESPAQLLAKPWEGRRYQGAAVEVQVYDRTAGQWTPWRQLFANAAGPDPELRKNPGLGGAPFDGAPYTRTLADAGDTFERYPRVYRQETVSYVREVAAPVAYAFSGRSTPGPGGFTESSFDLTPFVGERVRFAFHGWTGGHDPHPVSRHWLIGQAEVVGRVMSSGDALLRFRLGTDASILEGSWAIDQFEVTGTTYVNSVGIHVEKAPLRIESNGFASIEGYVRNYGTSDRRFIGVGLINHSFATARVIDGMSAPVPPNSRYAAIAVIDTLAQGGREGSSAPFHIQLQARPGATSHDVTLELLTGSALDDLNYVLASDDVPGRARRAFQIGVANEVAFEMAPPILEPLSLSTPGPARVKGTVTNTGTVARNVSAVAIWRDATGALVEQQEIALGRLQAGQAVDFASPNVALPAIGNYTIALRTNTTSDLPKTVFYRVGVDDRALTANFETGLDNWTTTKPEGIHLVEEAARGRQAVLMGIDPSLYEAGVRPADIQLGEVELRSPPVDLRHALPDARVSFWYRSALAENGHVELFAQNAAGTCTAFLPPVVPLASRTSSWKYASIPLADVKCGGAPLIGSLIRLGLSVTPDDLGWFVDAITVESGVITASPVGRDFDISDSAHKSYRIRVENPGRAPREVFAAVDPEFSQFTQAQSRWLSVVPGRFTLMPGETRDVELQVDSPAARGAFRQKLNATVAVATGVTALAPSTARIGLAFEPLSRHDIALAITIDGRTPEGARLPLEESVPHEITATITNQGLEPSRSTILRLFVRETSTGEVVWEKTIALRGILPYSLTEDSEIISGSWKPEFGRRGNFTLHAVADPDHDLVDYDRTNDALTIPLEVSRLIRPDLSLDASRFAVSTLDGRRVREAVPGQVLRIEGLVRNVGLADAHEVVVRLVAGGSVLKEEIVDVLGPGEAYAIRANQIAPSKSVLYRMLVQTSDLEISTTNNERSIELPIFPDEIHIVTTTDEVRIEPGGRLAVPLELANDGPYPVTLELSLEDDRFATLDQTRFALGPGERRATEVAIDIPTSQIAGELVIVVRAESTDGPRAQRSLVVDVPARPAASLIPYLARGPPSAVRVELDIVNTGNVPLSGDLIARDKAGTEIGRTRVTDVPPGKIKFTAAELTLAPTTSPGNHMATITFESATTRVAETRLELDVSAWGRLDVRVEPRPETRDRVGEFDLHLTYVGNAPSTRRPVLMGLPAGAEAGFTSGSLDFLPGETRTLQLRVDATAAAPHGLFALQAAFIDPATEAAARGANGARVVPHDPSLLTTVLLDLRTAKPELLGVERTDGHDELVERDRLTYLVRVRNDGDRRLANAPVELYIDGLLADRIVVSELAPGASTEVALSWTVTAGKHSAIVALDPHGIHRSTTSAFGESLDVLPGGIVNSATRAIPAAPLLFTLAAIAVAFLSRRMRA